MQSGAVSRWNAAEKSNERRERPCAAQHVKYVEAEVYSKDPLSYVDRAARFNEVIGLRGTEGNAVLISEEEYDAIMETIHICRDPKVREEIMEAADEILEECIAEEDADW